LNFNANNFHGEIRVCQRGQQFGQFVISNSHVQQERSSLVGVSNFINVPFLFSCCGTPATPGISASGAHAGGHFGHAHAAHASFAGHATHHSATTPGSRGSISSKLFSKNVAASVALEILAWVGANCGTTATSHDPTVSTASGCRTTGFHHATHTAHATHPTCSGPGGGRSRVAITTSQSQSIDFPNGCFGDAFGVAIDIVDGIQQ
jgi:hypothetical protein